jgi:regulator of protease activity HflC (stomatin/prohibitin superfamily)
MPRLSNGIDFIFKWVLLILDSLRFESRPPSSMSIVANEKFFDTVEIIDCVVDDQDKVYQEAIARRRAAKKDAQDKIAAVELVKYQADMKVIDRMIADRKAVEVAAEKVREAEKLAVKNAAEAKIDAALAKIYALSVWAQWCRKFWIVTGLEFQRVYGQFDRV